MQANLTQYCEKPLKMWDGLTTELKRIRSLDGFDKVGAFAMPFFALGILIHGDQAPVAFQKMTDVYEEYRNFYDATGWVNVIHDIRQKPVIWEIVAFSKRVLFDAVTVMTANEIAAMFGLPSFAKIITIATPFKDISFSIGKVSAEVAAIPLKVVFVIIALSESIFEKYELHYKIQENSKKLERKTTWLNGEGPLNERNERVITLEAKIDELCKDIYRIEVPTDALHAYKIKEVENALIKAVTSKTTSTTAKEDENSKYIELVKTTAMYKLLKKVRQNPNSIEAAKDLLGIERLIQMDEECFKQNKLEQYSQKEVKYKFEHKKNLLNLATDVPKVFFLSMIAGKAQFGIEAMKWLFRSEIIGTALNVKAQTVYDVGFQAIKLVSGTLGGINFLFYAEEPKVMRPADFKMKAS